MIQFTAELEDVVFTATYNPGKDEWFVRFSESMQAQRDFGEIGNPLTREIILNGEEVAALFFLAANGDESSVINIQAMYDLLEPKLVGIPFVLRPIP